MRDTRKGTIEDNRTDGLLLGEFFTYQIFAAIENAIRAGRPVEAWQRFELKAAAAAIHLYQADREIFEEGASDDCDRVGIGLDGTPWIEERKAARIVGEPRLVAYDPVESEYWAARFASSAGNPGEDVPFTLKHRKDEWTATVGSGAKRVSVVCYDNEDDAQSRCLVMAAIKYHLTTDRARTYWEIPR
ncbi:hypothetical protein EON81_03020 [bacterium]|nr:MAG: hypothetical protein EON81_03020 [bacterium]